MNIQVDSREPPKIREALAAAGAGVCQLNVGDYLIRAKNVNYIFERKTLQDLRSSIQRGHWQSQCERLRNLQDQNPETVRTFLIVEGALSLSDEMSSDFVEYSSVSWESVQHAILNVQIRDRFGVIMSASGNTTVNILKHIAKQVEPGSTKTHVQHLGQSPKQLIADNLFMHQMMLIKGMSQALAKAFVARFPNMQSVFRHFQDMDSADAISEISQIRPEQGTRRIGAMLANRVYESFFSTA